MLRAALAVMVLWPSAALAYRPFDSTDAAVAGRGETEIELSPLSWNSENRTLIAPAARLNYGFAPDWEIVLEGQGEHPAGGSSALTDDALSLKTVVREGSLQDQTGPSLAVEGALLLPEAGGDPGAGFEIAGIASRRWDWGAVSFNLAAGRSRSGAAEVFSGLILEGPERWPVRPVAEITYRRTIDTETETGMLLGGIWQVSEKFALDLGWRRAWWGGGRADEVRAGLTFTFSAR